MGLGGAYNARYSYFLWGSHPFFFKYANKIFKVKCKPSQYPFFLIWDNKGIKKKTF